MIYPGRPQSTEEVGRHYDVLDAFYRDIWGDHVHHGLWLEGEETSEQAVRNLVRYAVRGVGLEPGRYVCDVGCGYGATAHFLASEWRVDVTGLTVSSLQHAYAMREYAGTNCRFLLQDWMENSLEPSTFDLILAIESLAHMPDKARFFAEAFRVLKPGGSLVVLAWLADRDVRPFQRRHLLEPICTEGRLASLPDAGEVETLAGDGGFAVVRSTDLSAHVRRTWSICLQRLLGKILTDRRYQRYLLDSHSTDRAFLLTVFRILTAYRTGAMRYGLFTAVRPG